MLKTSLNNKADNYEFYSCSQGHEILNTDNFSPDIIDFLNSERDIIQKILFEKKEKYDALLEVGCGHARNISLSSLLGLKYFGIDFIEKEITGARQKIEKNKLAGQVKCISVLDLDHNSTPIPHHIRTISLFPFNVFGNIFEPNKALQAMQKLGYDILISTYRNDVQKNSILQYYNACGLSDIETISSDNGTMFLSKQGFKSIIYTSEYIQQIAKQCGLKIDCFEFSNLGKLYYILGENTHV